ncbi:MAG: high frequency lysogenization protein HflD [Pseudomonadota bacterium]|nr:high frequency lysogenization protein HflD [Pseudomonadota bacterium]
MARYSEGDRILALAGVFQAAELVQQIARTGRAEEVSLRASLGSLMAVDADSVESIYGGREKLQLGLDSLIATLSNPLTPQRLTPVSYYVATLVSLERRLHRNAHRADLLAEGIRAAVNKSRMFDLMDEPLIEHLAALYQEITQGLQPRIIVRGDGTHLRQARNASLVRSLLLAAIRSAYLWRQCGGSRLAVLLRRRNLVALARRERGAISAVGPFE